MADPKFKPTASSVMTPTGNIKRKDVLVKTPALVGEIVEVSWDTSIKAAREKIAIVAPHWKKGDKAEEDAQPDGQKYPTGSKRPGVYLVKSKKSVDTLTVKVNITKSEGQEPEAKLFAHFAGLRLEGKCPTGLGAHDVKVTIHELPDTLQHYEGDVSWGLDTSKMLLPLANKTRLELFVILDNPASFYHEGAWAEALRFVFKKAKVAGAKTEAEAAAKIAAHCHSHHDMRYDTAIGQAHFGTLGRGAEPFHLMKYMSWKLFPLTKANVYGDLMNSVVNCYDQAAAVQALAGVVGVKTQWVFDLPYGYIQTTNLVGVGNCNNPFFNASLKRADGSLVYLYPRDHTVTDPNLDRSSFRNHAFLQMGNANGNVLDACAGPHLGGEDMATYVGNSVDSVRSVKKSTFLDDAEIFGVNRIRPATADEYTRVLTNDIPNRPAGLPSLVFHKPPV